jgi:hypothetical protein
LNVYFVNFILHPEAFLDGKSCEGGVDILYFADCFSISRVDVMSDMTSAIFIKKIGSGMCGDTKFGPRGVLVIPMPGKKGCRTLFRFMSF